MASLKVSTHSLRRHASLAATCLVFSLGAGASLAQAQEPGVVYEPGSPSAKEYAIPLEEARRDAGGARPGSEEALAFGIGISRRTGGRSGSASGADGRTRSGSAAGKRRQRTAESTSQSPGFRERLADAEGVGAPFLWALLPLLLVLLPGLLVGLLLARRGGQQQPAT